MISKFTTAIFFVFVFTLAIISLSACATIEKSKSTICARKAEAIHAAQAVIDSLNAYCPVEAAQETQNVPD